MAAGGEERGGAVGVEEEVARGGEGWVGVGVEVEEVVALLLEGAAWGAGGDAGSAEGINSAGARPAAAARLGAAAAETEVAGAGSVAFVAFAGTD